LPVGKNTRFPLFPAAPHDAAPSKTIIHNRNTRVINIRFDFNRSEIDLFPYLNEKVEGLTRMCDYIIFYQRKGKLYVFLCELKSKNVKGSAKQVQAAEVFANFIIRMAKRHLLDHNLNKKFFFKKHCKNSFKMR
jgi:hypothetical protein